MKTILLTIASLFTIIINAAAQGAPPTTSDFCTVMEKVLLSGPKFESLKGAKKGANNTATSYESLVSVPGSINSEVNVSKMGSSSFLVNLIKTTDETEATRKYNETAKALDCNWIMGVMDIEEQELTYTKTRIWSFTTLNADYKTSHRSLTIEVVWYKHFNGSGFEVFMKISY